MTGCVVNPKAAEVEQKRKSYVLKINVNFAYNKKMVCTFHYDAMQREISRRNYC